MNRPDFVQAFLDHGLILSKFLTYRRLLKLYNDVRSFFYNLIFSNNFKIESSFILKIPEDSVLYSFLLRNRRIEQSSFKVFVSDYIASIKSRAITKKAPDGEMYFGFPEIGKCIEENLDNFYFHQFNRHPFAFISSDNYKTILQQTVRNINSNICIYVND